MEEFVKRTLLYDFYGELLTPRQREMYESVVLEDYSISEIAAEQNISRQGVHDMIRRCDAALEDYEARLHLVDRFLEIRRQVRRIEELAAAHRVPEITDICRTIVGEL